MGESTEKKLLGDKAGRPELFRQTNIDLATMLENLSILLADDNKSASKSSTAAIALPTNEDALKRLTTTAYHDVIEYDVYAVNEPCVNLWYEKGNVTWYIGYFRKMVTTSTYELEQLLRFDEKSDLFWMHPQKPVIDVIDDEQVLRLTNGKRHPVHGTWNNERLNKFCLKTMNEIIKSFESFKVNFI